MVRIAYDPNHFGVIFNFIHYINYQIDALIIICS